MSKVIFAAPMELKEEFTGAELEKFWVEEYLPNITDLPGYQVQLVRGSFGKRADKYMYLGHFVSSARRDELFPVMGDATGSEEWQQWIAANPVWLNLMGFFDESWITEFTDYLEVS